MRLLLLLILSSMTSVHASTFVGNGGGAGDVELAVTKKQIEETFTAIRTRSVFEHRLCRCNEVYENRNVCEPLRALNDEQRKFCAESLIRLAPDVLASIYAIDFQWTHSPISVSVHGQTRAVDAVTDRSSRRITINLDRFLDMKPFERVFLVTHEMLHLTNLQGKAINDDGAVGPFSGSEGGRTLLNSMGSSAAVLQGELPGEIKKYRAKLHRSQSWKPIWLEMNYGTSNLEQKPRSTFAASEFYRSQFTARYVFGNWGLVGSLRTETADNKVFGVINVDEKVSITSGGAIYRWFVSKDPTTFWGQNHVLFQGLIDFVNAEIKLDDGTVTAAESVKTTGFNVSVNYYIPFFWGFWAFLGSAYEVHPYKYETVNLNYDKNKISYYLGVSYAF
jgi:hypothetical protein